MRNAEPNEEAYLLTKLGSGRVTLQAEAIYTSATR
jgi:hypothetical protein